MHNNILPDLPLTQPAAIFLAVLAIILVVPMLMNRLKIPYIIGLIAAGMAVGPYGLNILTRDASFQIFGEVGILYLMFLAGVEIDMYDLKRNWKSGTFFGMLTFLFPMVAGLIGSHYLLHTDWLSSTLVATMFASHTLLTYPVMAKFGLTNSRASVIAVCGTIVAVLLALIVLAGIVQAKIHGGFDSQGSLWLMIKLLLFTSISGWFGSWVSRMFFRKFNDLVTQFVYVLAMVFLFAVTAEMAGVAGILGAFYAGLILNRYIPMRSGLKRRIEFVGNAIFIPYFLIGVGMLINVHLIFNGLGVIYTALIMTGLALSSKWIAAYSTQKILGLNHLQRQIIFGLTSGKAAATIAATMIGYQYGLLNENILNGAVLMILFCCIAASIATQRGAIKLRMKWTGKELSHHSDRELRTGAQMVALANPVTAQGLMKLAVFMRNENGEKPSTLVYIRNSDDAMREAMGRNSLNLAAETAEQTDTPVREVIRFDMNIVSGMVNVMKETSCSEIILGLHKQTTVIDSFLGSMEERLLKSTNSMLIMSRCFAPLNTLKRLFVVVTPKAEYETGFRMWVNRIGNLAQQLGCPTEFMATEETSRFIAKELQAQNFDFNHEFIAMESWDDFIILSSRISEEDILVCIMARKRSISYGSEVEQLPSFLHKYFNRHNLILIYPEQFGTTEVSPAPLDALAHTI